MELPQLNPRLALEALARHEHFGQPSVFAAFAPPVVNHLPRLIVRHHGWHDRVDFGGLMLVVADFSEYLSRLPHLAKVPGYRDAPKAYAGLAHKIRRDTANLPLFFKLIESDEATHMESEYVGFGRATLRRHRSGSLTYGKLWETQPDSYIAMAQDRPLARTAARTKAKAA